MLAGLIVQKFFSYEAERISSMQENLYKAPESELDLEDDFGEIKRPKLVWVILIIYILGLPGLILHFVMIEGMLPLEGAAKEYYTNLGLIDNLLIVFGTMYGFIAAVQLFRLKKSALKLFYGLIFFSIIASAYNFADSNYIAMMNEQGSSMYYSLVPSYVVMLLIVAYVYRLSKKGILHRS